MNPNSLFAILIRSPWWISMAVGAGLFALARTLLPEAYAPYGIFTALPFFGIGGYAAWKQLRAPSPERVAAALEALRALPWDEFSAALAHALAREGYNVKPLAIAGAEFELTRSGRVTLVGCKRWKVARAGIEPLKELAAARKARDAHECLYVAAGEVTDNARAFAAENNIRVIESAELAALFPGAKRSSAR